MDNISIVANEDGSITINLSADLVNKYPPAFSIEKSSQEIIDYVRLNQVSYILRKVSGFKYNIHGTIEGNEMIKRILTMVANAYCRELGEVLNGEIRNDGGGFNTHIKWSDGNISDHSVPWDFVWKYVLTEGLQIEPSKYYLDYLKKFE